MKRAFMVLALLFYSSLVFSQIYLDGRDINRLVKDDYILLYLTRPMCKTRVYYRLPEKCKLLEKNRIPVTDRNGRILKFNSVTEVISLFERNGWIYRGQITDFSGAGLSDARSYFLFQRKKEAQ